MDKDIYSPYQSQELKSWEAYLNSNTKRLKDAFYKIIFNHDYEHNLKVPREEKIDRIEFYHGADELDMLVEFYNFDDGPIEKLNDESCIISKWEDFDVDWNFDFLWPADLDVFCEDYRDLRLSSEKRTMFFTWFAKCWSECGGMDLGIRVTTEENSVRRIFNLIHMNWDSSIVDPYRGDGNLYESPLRRKLTDYEIKSRVEFNRRKRYKMHWRYFEKDQQFYEYGFYDLKVYYRNGDVKNDPFLPFKSKPYKVQEFFDVPNRLANDGFYENPRPESFAKIHPDFVEWDFHLFNSSEQIIEDYEFSKVENELGLSFPGNYKWFVSRFNEDTSIENSTHFRRGFEDWHLIEKFYTIMDLAQILQLLKSKSKIPDNTIPIAISKSNLTVMLDCKSQEVFCLGEGSDLKKIAHDFQDFLNKCIYISGYFCPRTYHIERNNISTVRSWIKEGWDMKDLKTTRSILNLCYDTEMNIMLLKNGADPNGAVFHSGLFNQKYIRALIDHGLDITKQLDKNEWFRPGLERLGGFEDVLKKYDQRSKLD